MEELPVCRNCAYPLCGLFVSNVRNCPFCGMRVPADQNDPSVRGRVTQLNVDRRGFSGRVVHLFLTLRRGCRSRSASARHRNTEIQPEASAEWAGRHLGSKSQSVTSLFPPIDAKKGGFRRNSDNREREREKKTTWNSLKDSSSRSPPPLYTAAQLKKAISRARSSGKWEEVHLYYRTTFSSFQDLNIAFKCRERGTKPTKSGIDLRLLETCCEQLLQLPTEIQKAVLKVAINCLLTDQKNFDAILLRPVAKADMRAYFALLHNPQFKKPSTYVVFAHLLRHIATLCQQDHQELSEWFEEISEKQFKSIISTIHQLICIRLFPPKPEDLPPIGKCSWWIPCAIKCLAILNSANERTNLVHYSEFYNQALDHWDLLSDFIQWQMPNLSALGSFCFCQYPFILSINAKKTILEGQAEQQMIATARESIIGNLAANRSPDVDMLFLNIAVRREHLLQDSIAELSKKQGHLGKKLRVKFTGEPGLDMGGLTKEWFQLLIRQIFHPDYGMFVYYKGSEVYWFSTLATEGEENLREYHLVGILMGLALYNGVILDIRLPLICYKKLLSPPVLPRLSELRNQNVGEISGSLEELAQIAPDTAHGLQELLDYNGNVDEDFGLNFQISLKELGEIKTVNLKPNGEKIAVNNSNRKEYVDFYIDYMLNEAIVKQFRAFYLGFHSVCTSNVLLLLRPAEIELLVCGNPIFNMEELRQVTTYDGYKTNDKTIRYFWDLVLKLPQRHQKRLLLFVTGTDRVPAGGMKEMNFKISKMAPTQPLGDTTQMLPIAHTCFNHLVLPDYQNRQLLRQRIAIALTHGEGFGLE